VKSVIQVSEVKVLAMGMLMIHIWLKNHFPTAREKQHTFIAFCDRFSCCFSHSLTFSEFCYRTSLTTKTRLKPDCFHIKMTSKVIVYTDEILVSSVAVERSQQIHCDLKGSPLG